MRVPCVIGWPGLVAPGTRSDAVIQGCDFYPTFIDALGLKPAKDQTFDGISIVPALKGKPLEREAIFSYFPHNPPIPEWLPPSVTVWRNDWKLIRIFFEGEDGAHRWKLYNLKDDIGEKNDLSKQEPERVKELDLLIERFLANTKAVTPIPNPGFKQAAYQPEREGVGKLKPIRNPKAAPKKKRTPPAKPKSDPKAGK